MTTPSALRESLENLGGAAWVNQLSSGSRETDGLADRPIWVERLLRFVVAEDAASAVVGRRTVGADGGDMTERRAEPVERKDGEERET